MPLDALRAREPRLAPIHQALDIAPQSSFRIINIMECPPIFRSRRPLPAPLSVTIDLSHTPILCLVRKSTVLPVT